MSNIGRPRQELCIRGHLLAETRHVAPNGKTTCSACKKENSKSSGRRTKAREYTKANPEKIRVYRDSHNKRHPEAYVVYSKRYRDRHPDAAKNAARKRKYGMTSAEFETMRLLQGNECAICKQTPTRFHVDHCHSTGQIRSLLCGKCNTGIGMLGDSIDLLKQAVIYLELHNFDLIQKGALCTQSL